MEIPSKNKDANKRELHFVFRVIKFHTEASKGEIVSESFVSVKPLSTEENIFCYCRHNSDHGDRPGDENRTDRQKSKSNTKEHAKTRKKVHFKEAVYVFSDPPDQD